MAENKNKDKEKNDYKKLTKMSSLKTIKTSKPVSKNTKPSSESKKQNQLIANQLFQKILIANEKKIYHKIIKTNLLKMMTKKKMIQIMTKKIFIRKNPKVP